MEEIYILPETELVDLLSVKTDLYFKKMSEASSLEEVTALRKLIDEIINQINKRKTGYKYPGRHKQL